jgi:biopolymer transport protein ExbD
MLRRARRGHGGAARAPRGSAHDDRPPEVGVTPMIDVMMVMLIIFMLVTPAVMSYGLVLPRAKHATPSSLEDVVTVGVAANGRLVVGKDTVEDAALPALLRETYERRPGDHLLYLWADKGADYARVLDVIEVARGAGVRTVGAIVEPVDRAGAGSRTSDGGRPVATRER